MTVLVDDTTIVLTGTVGNLFWDEPGFSAAEVSLALAQVGHERDVLIRLNSDGGYASEGAAIHAAIARHKGRVRLVVEGIAASSASLLMQAADERIMAPGSILMIHDPAAGTFGTVADHETAIRYLSALATSFAGIYGERAGRTPEQARQDMAAEVWFSPEEAVAAGYADRVGNEEADANGAEIIEFPDRVADPLAFAVMRHTPTAYRNAPEPIKALASANGRTAPRSSQAAQPVAPQRQESTMTTTPKGGGQASTPETPTPPSTNVVDLDAARQDGRTQALAYAREVGELCQLAGRPSDAQAFIAAEKPVAEVRTALIEARAKADPQTTSQHPPATARFDLAGAMKKGA